jgi:hypothetical protein
MLDQRRDQSFTILFISVREELYNGKGGPYLDDITSFNEAWWLYLDEYIDEAAQRGLYVGIALGWWGHIHRNTVEDLYKNGFLVAQRLTGKTNVIWLVAGEAGSHHRKHTIDYNKMEAIVQGLRAGDDDDRLLTIHADFQRGTSLSKDAELVDFNNWQTSQWCCPEDLPRQDERQWTVWEAIAYDYAQLYDTPSGAKPTLDAEAWYEHNKDFCGTTPFNIRRRAYYTILAGALGHQYGAGGIWDAISRSEECSGSYLDALAYSGAEDMGHLSSFLHGLGDGLLKLRPNQGMITRGQSEDYDAHIQAAQAKDGSYAVIYDANGGTMALDLTYLSWNSIEVKWFNPDNGKFTEVSIVYNNGNSEQEFTAPSSDQDWVLLLKASNQ